jgi:hypothetical protein
MFGLHLEWERVLDISPSGSDKSNSSRRLDIVLKAQPHVPL